MSAVRVGGIGPKDSKIAFVGEALGADEERLQEPFVGASGQLLTRLMNEAGIPRQQCYITNVIKEHPPGNNIGKFITIGKSSLVATQAYKDYVAKLRDELAAINPNVIVAVGRIAMYALTGRHDRISKRRGSIMESTLLPGKKVIPIIHPAAALRQYEFTQMIAFDLHRIKEDSQSPALDPPRQNIKTEPTFIESLEWLANARNCSDLAFDIEVIKTMQDWEISCIGFSYDEGTISIPFVWEQGDYFNPDQEAIIWQQIAKLLEADSPRKITQNGVFDAHFLYRKLGIRAKVHHDTMIAMALINPDVPKGLDFIASIYTREPYYKDDGKTWFKIGGKYRDLWLYNAKDALVTYEALFPMMRDLERLGNIEAYHAQVALIPALMYMQERGIKLKLGDMRTMAEEVRIKINGLQQDLYAIAGDALQLKPTARGMCPSTQQLMDYFYTKKRIKPYISRATGNQTCDAMALQRIANKGYKEASIVLEIRKLDKLRSTYLEMQVDADERFRSSFNPVGTVNSRLSSSKSFFGTGGNAQNLPKSFRVFFVADNGYVVYELDLSQAENRTVAYIAPEPAMTKAFERGDDIHSLTASMIFGVLLNEVNYEQRQWGKKTNHGLNYDMGYKKFAFLHGIPEADANYMVERYHASYPGVRIYHSWVQHKLRQDRTLINCFGRSRRFTGRWGPDLFRDAYDYIPQSSVATKLNRDGVLETYNRQDLYPEVELLNQVHDSIWIQIPIAAGWERHAEILLSLKAALEAPISWKTSKFSIPADIKMGLNFYRMAAVPTDCRDAAKLAEVLSEVYKDLISPKNEERTDLLSPDDFEEGDPDERGMENDN